MKYGEETRRHTRALIEQGLSNDDILTFDACKGIKRSDLRQWRFRIEQKKKRNGVAPEIATPGKKETLQNENATPLQREAATQETAPQPLENAIETPILWKFAKEAYLNFHPADALYFIGVALACYAVANTLQGVGAPVAVVMFGVSAVALQGLKTTAGAWRWVHGATLLVFECANAAVHYSWANAALWKNIGALPFSVYVEKYQNGAGEWVAFYAGADIEMPCYVACGIAAVLFAAGLYASLLALKK